MCAAIGINGQFNLDATAKMVFIGLPCFVLGGYCPIYTRLRQSNARK